MSVYGDIYIRLNDKNYNLEEDFDIGCAKSMVKIQDCCAMSSYVKQNYFYETFLGKPAKENGRDYISELDIGEWLEDEKELIELEDPRDNFYYGLIRAFAALPEVRIFFRTEFSQCLGEFNMDTSKKWEEKGWAINFDNQIQDKGELS